MKKILGITTLLIVVVAATAALSPNFLTAYNVQNIIRWSALFGILSVGVAFVIVTGGIDLSIGSVVGLVGCTLAMLLNPIDERPPGWAWKSVFQIQGCIAIVAAVIWGLARFYGRSRGSGRRLLWLGLAGAALFAAGRYAPGFDLPAWLHLPFVVLWVLALSLQIGLLHGLLITKIGLQPFVVTLCGLLFYRGLTRWVAADQTQGFGSGFTGLRKLATGKLPLTDDFALPVPAIALAVLAILSGVLLNKTIFGRYMLALGRNETATRYSGIDTDRYVILAYAICSLLAGIGGILFALDINSIQPSGHGNFYELYAIAAAVLGGCSLRGGEGSILGVVIGAAVMRVLYNAINVLGIPTQLEFAIIGLVILGGVIADELVKRLAAKRRAARQARDPA
ncbi:MAG: ABC transporter permease [bacterium]|nr:ABC transporter permease [bacterium]